MKYIYFTLIFNLLAFSGFSTDTENTPFSLKVEFILTQAITHKKIVSADYKIVVKPSDEVGEIKKHLINFFYQEASKRWPKYSDWQLPQFPHNIPVVGGLPRELYTLLLDQQDRFAAEINDIPFVFAQEKIKPNKTIKDLNFFDKSESEQKLTIEIAIRHQINSIFFIKYNNGKTIQKKHSCFCYSLKSFFLGINSGIEDIMYELPRAKLSKIELVSIFSNEEVIKEFSPELLSSEEDFSFDEVAAAGRGSDRIKFIFYYTEIAHSDDAREKVTPAKNEALSLNVAIQVKGGGRKEFLLTLEDPQQTSLEALLPMFREQMPEIPKNHTFLIVADKKDLLKTEGTVPMARIIEKYPILGNKLVCYTF
jgi:hypothetical protein